MPTRHASQADGEQRPGRGSPVEQLLARVLEPLGIVMLSRDRIQETLEDAVRRGRVTRSDANELAGELLRRGRQQTEELMGEIERMLDGSRDRIETAGRRAGVHRIARSADRARRVVSSGPGGFPIPDYDNLTARQVQTHLGGLGPGQLRQVHEHERRHANRKTVLEAVERALAD